MKKGFATEGKQLLQPATLAEPDAPSEMKSAKIG